MDFKEALFQWFIKSLIKSPLLLQINLLLGVQLILLLTQKQELILILKKKQLTEELHKPNIKTFKRIKIYYSFKDNIWGAVSSDMQLMSKH